MIVLHGEVNAAVELMLLELVTAWISRSRKKAGAVAELVRSSLFLPEH
jgi:hypothetical protein